MTELWGVRGDQVGPNLLLTTFPPSSDLLGFIGTGLLDWPVCVEPVW